ncbi:hypothetical protein [Massilia sp. YMA4]|uniref:hypothetical protein n=1 Tax=Massilia sp. YMA4 TaxID=1593482 RepID=UPI001878AFEC|nr:hypothetical protein [Massilia sp. YMA4]
MTSKTTPLLQVKKSLIHNGRRLCLIRDYKIDGEDACSETCVTRLEATGRYRVWHYDFLEKFVDVREKYFRYENYEFDTFEDAIQFIEENLAVSLSELT